MSGAPDSAADGPSGQEEGRPPVPGMPWPPRRICIVVLSALGDVVHTLPVATALKRRWPDVHITWILQPLPYQLLREHPAVSDFILFQRRRGLKARRSYAEVRKALRGRKFDLVLAMQTAFKANLLLPMIDAPVKLGFDRARAADLNWLFTNHRIPARPAQHQLEEKLEFLRCLGVDPEPVRWDLRLEEGERAAQQRFFERLERPVCAVVLATSKPEKNWMSERYARVVEALEREYGYRVVLVGGPSDVERRVADEVLYRIESMPVDALDDDLRKLVWILDGADLVISPDTGPLHIARALDTPVIGLYGYTNPKRSGPYGRYQDLVVDGFARHAGEDYEPDADYRKDGMARVQAYEVLEKVKAAEKYIS